MFSLVFISKSEDAFKFFKVQMLKEFNNQVPANHQLAEIIFQAILDGLPKETLKLKSNNLQLLLFSLKNNGITS
jgi:hypothetical protein